MSTAGNAALGCDWGNICFSEAFRFLELSWRKRKLLLRSVTSGVREEDPRGARHRSLGVISQPHSGSWEGGCEGRFDVSTWLGYSSQVFEPQ